MFSPLRCKKSASNQTTWLVPERDVIVGCVRASVYLRILCRKKSTGQQHCFLSYQTGLCLKEVRFGCVSVPHASCRKPICSSPGTCGRMSEEALN